jgi:nucleotide-binding universal stress UspA family protein
MVDSIAVGVDGSSASRSAVEWAIARAVRESSALVLLHVAPAAARSGAETDALVAAELDYARAISPGVQPTIEVLAGDTVGSLADASNGFALLAIGTHKTGFLRGRAFGSVGPRLAAVISVPLAVIPAPSGRPRRGMVVGINDDLSAIPALRLAARDAAESGGELTVIHAQPTHGLNQLTAALALVAAEFPGVRVHTRAVLGDPGEVLINATAVAECLYIGGTELRGRGLGAVGYDVLLNISGPTILVPLEHKAAGAQR